MKIRELVQVSKLDQGLTLYAWRKVGIINPVDSVAVEWISGGTVGDGLSAEGTPGAMTASVPLGAEAGDELLWLPEGMAGPTGYERWMMNRSLYGQTKSGFHGRWGVCWSCQEEYPLREMTKSGGQWYCESCKELAR